MSSFITPLNGKMSIVAKNDGRVYTNAEEIKSQTGAKSEAYFTQLDVLRAVAVLLVIVSHWFSSEHIFNKYIPNGILGVTLFFVLSGFLITGILLRSKVKIESGDSFGNAFKTFYLRRALRIFPVYYVLLIALWVFQNRDVIADFWSHFFYLSNFLFFNKGSFEGQASHFWSLAVEEQFYLFWPAVILIAPIRYLPKIFMFGIVGSILFRYLLFDPPLSMGRFLMPASLDSFCLGALLAYGKYKDSLWYIFLNRRRAVVSVLALIAVIGFSYYIVPGSVFYISFYYTFISVLFSVIIMACAEGVTNRWLRYILDNRILIYFGKISYGLYLFHNFIPYFYSLTIPEILSPISMYIAQGLRLLVLVIIATASWYILEKQVLKLKDRFTY